MLTELLHIYNWILISIVILIIGTIGYFYQKKFNIKTNYYLFILSAVLTFSVCLHGGKFLHFLHVDYAWIEFIEMTGIWIASVVTLKLFKAMTGAV